MKGKILLLAMFALSFQVFSQVKTEKVNPDQIPQRIQKEGMRPISLTIPDEEVVLRELEESVLGANSENESFDFGRFFPFELNFEIIESLCKDGKCFKEIEVEYGGMNTLGFVFDQLDLSKNAKFYLINDEAGYIQGPITRESVNVPRGFISGLMPGDRLRLLLEEPENEQNTSIIRINEASFGIFDFFNVSKYSSRLNSSNPCWGFGCSASCNINIACTSSLDLESKAVALVLIKNPSNNTYSIRGTGALINNGYQDRKFLFITASHIYNSFEWDNNSQFVFHYKSLQCSPTTNGSLTIYVQGATNIIPTGQGHTDLKLVELKVGSGGNPLFASNPVSFLGWSIIDELSAVQGIHHPRGDVQKLFTGTNVQVYNETIGTGNYNYWKFDLAS